MFSNSETDGASGSMKPSILHSQPQRLNPAKCLTEALAIHQLLKNMSDDLHEKTVLQHGQLEQICHDTIVCEKEAQDLLARIVRVTTRINGLTGK